MAPDREQLAAARAALARLGVTVNDLQRDARPRVPTFAEYLPQVAAAAGPGARRTYGSYWLEALRHTMVAAAMCRRTSRGGRHAGEHVIAAARAVYTRAIADGLIEPGASPAHRVAKPRRLPGSRRALTADELDDINLAARTSGNDVVLDALILRLHTETACRRGGALGLRLMDLDVAHGLVRLREKGGTERWQPITLHLAGHARCRGGVLPTDTLLRYRTGAAITSRRYDHLWKRIDEQLPWVAAQGITTHWLRHTTLTWVERHFGYATARAYTGHTDSTGPATTTYVKADLHAVAAALAAMTDQPHPMGSTE